MKIDLSDVPETLTGGELRARVLARFRTLNQAEDNNPTKVDVNHRCSEKAMLAVSAQNQVDTAVFLSNGGLASALRDAMRLHGFGQDKPMPTITWGNVKIDGFKMADVLRLVFAIGMVLMLLSVIMDRVTFAKRVQTAMGWFAHEDSRK